MTKAASTSRRQARSWSMPPAFLPTSTPHMADPRRQRHDRAQPGHPSGLRTLVPARRHRRYGAAYQRRPRDVRHSLARPHPRRHDRHRHRRARPTSRCPFEQEIEFILDTAARYLSRPPKRSDVLSVYVGIRPLVKAGGAATAKPRRSRATTPSMSIIPACSRS